MQVMYHLCLKNTILSKHISSLFQLNYTKMLLSSSKLDRTIALAYD